MAPMKNSGKIFALGSILLVSGLARAELVIEQDRENLRQAMDVSNKAQVTRQAAKTQVVQQELLPPTTVTTVTTTEPTQAMDPQPSPGMENISRTELLRRERVREELQNEDILQTRIEELRLRDERSRTKKLLGMDAMSTSEESKVAGPEAGVVPAPLTQYEEVGSAPAGSAQAPGVIQPLTSYATPEAMPVQPVSTSSYSSSSSDSEKTKISIMPRAGISNLMGTEQYKVSGRYSAGLGVMFGVADNLAVEGGWSHSEYGVSLMSSNPFVQQYQSQYSYQAGDFNRETQTMKQDVFDAGLRMYLMGPDSKFRPFIGGGAAYAKSYLNYDQAIMDAAQSMNYPIGSDYEVSSFLGTLSTGFDIALSKSISVGGLFRYYWVLSSRENSNINNAALYGNQPYGGYGMANPYTYAASEADKRYVGGSLSRAGFYSLLAGVTFTF